MKSGLKFAFKCECGESPVDLLFLPEHFLRRSSVHLDSLEGMCWALDKSGKVSLDSDGHRWPEELSKGFFMREARKYARKLLKGEDRLYCDACGSDLVITKI